MVGKKVQQKKGEANFSCAWLGTLERTQLQVMIIFISEDIIRGPVSKESNLGCVWAEHTMSSRCKNSKHGTGMAKRECHVGDTWREPRCGKGSAGEQALAWAQPREKLCSAWSRARESGEEHPTRKTCPERGHGESWACLVWEKVGEGNVLFHVVEAAAEGECWILPVATDMGQGPGQLTTPKIRGVA